MNNNNPVENYLKELEDHFHDKALFFYDKLGGDIIAVVLKPSSFVLKPFKLAHSSYTLPIEKRAIHLLPNIFEILSEFYELGHGLVESITFQ